MEDILIGVTDWSILVFIPDPASTDGSGKTGVAHSDLTVSYTRVETDNDVVNTNVTSSLNALTNLTDAHNDWGWKEVSNTLAPGLYRLDIADAVFAAGARYAVVYVMLTTDLAAATPKAFRLRNTAEADLGVNVVNVEEIQGESVIHGVADAGSTTTVIQLKSSDVTPTVSNQWKGRVVIFKKTTATAALRGQGAPIDSNNTTSITIAAGDALTTSPAEDDEFTIY